MNRLQDVFFSRTPGPRPQEERECHYCHTPGHVIADYRKRMAKEAASTPSSSTRKPFGFVKSLLADRTSSVGLDPSYAPFIHSGSVLLDDNTAPVKILMLRDTGAAQSVILTGVLPWSEESSCGYSVLLQGIEMGQVPMPLHYVNLRSDLGSGKFKVGLQPLLPVPGVTFILGKDIAGGRVSPLLEVFVSPEKPTTLDKLGTDFPTTFTECVVTHAQSRRLGDLCNLEDCVWPDT